MSLATATLVGTLANWGLVISLVGGVLSTIVIVQTTDVKEEHWAHDRQHSSERLAELSVQGDKLRLGISEANEGAKKAEVAAATANVEAARLRLELDKEIQKRAPRFLTNEQKDALLSELKGKIPKIAVVTQNDLEAKAFSIHFVILLQDAGAKPIYAPEAPRDDRWYAPAGLIMYSPAGQSEDQLKDDPLYRALKAANLFGGTTAQPFLSPEVRGPVPALIPGYTGHVLYIGQKSPF